MEATLTGILAWVQAHYAGTAWIVAAAGFITCLVSKKALYNTFKSFGVTISTLLTKRLGKIRGQKIENRIQGWLDTAHAGLNAGLDSDDNGVEKETAVQVMPDGSTKDVPVTGSGGKKVSAPKDMDAI